MARHKSGIPGANAFRQATNYVATLLFSRQMQQGSMTLSVTSTRTGDVTTMTVIHPNGVMVFGFTDADLERDVTPKQREYRRMLKENPDFPPAA